MRALADIARTLELGKYIRLGKVKKLLMGAIRTLCWEMR